MLELRGVSKRFGGVVATDEVSFGVARGEVHALIGPNGAGKTTLIGQISGSLGVDAGEIRFLGQDVTRARQHERVARGLARSYQITSIFKRFTVLDNLALAVQARSGSSFSFWRPVAAEAALFEEARSIAGEVGLAEKVHSLAATLAHGEQHMSWFQLEDKFDGSARNFWEEAAIFRTAASNAASTSSEKSTNRTSSKVESSDSRRNESAVASTAWPRTLARER